MAYRIPDELVERIKDSVDIVEVVSDYVSLQKKGRNFSALCPFHAEKTPSFSVSLEKQMYYCFGCGSGGNVFSFLMELEKVSFFEALRSLSERTGISLPSVGRGEKASNDDLYRANQLAKDYFCHLLCKDKRSEGARAYLRERGLSEETVQRFSLGYSLPDWDDLLKQAQKRGLSREILARAGLAIARKDGGFYDRFRERITFPIVGISGKVTGFGARTLDDDQEPKYLNSPDTEIYHKGSVLYGLHQAKDSIRKEGSAIVVEGYMDLIRLVQEGIDNAVASSGTAFTYEQARLLSRYTDRVIIVYDSDAAGSSASLRGMDVLLGSDLTPEIVSLPMGYDPDSFIKDRGKDSFYDHLNNASYFLDYKIDLMKKEGLLSHVEGKTKALNSLSESVSKVKDEIKRNLLIKGIADEFSVDEKTLYRAVGRIIDKSKRRTAKKTESDEIEDVTVSEPKWERELLKIMINCKHAVREAKDLIAPEDFTEKSHRQIASLIFKASERGVDVGVVTVGEDSRDSKLAKLISKISLEDFDESQIEQSLDDHIRRLQRKSIEKRIEELEAKIKEAENEGNDKKVTELLREHVALDRRKRSLIDIKKTS